MKHSNIGAVTMIGNSTHLPITPAPTQYGEDGKGDLDSVDTLTKFLTKISTTATTHLGL